LLFGFAACISLICCESRYRNKSYASIPDSNIDKGEQLAAVHCASCHAMPEPALLDVDSWEQGVLPQMGPRLGIFRHNFKDYPNQKNDPDLPKGYYPAEPVITAQEWQYIMDYYLATSPDTLPPQQRAKISQLTLPYFEAITPSYIYDSAAIVLTSIDTSGTKSILYFNDVLKQKIFTFDNQLNLKDSLYSNASLVDLQFSPAQIIGLDIGIMNPTNKRTGQLLSMFPDQSRDTLLTNATILQGLARPVAFTSGKLDSDDYPDYVVCEFGNLAGSLSIVSNDATGRFSKRTLSDQPGAIKAYIHDADKDGLNDIYVLFTQGRESIVLFLNKGNGKFESKELISFSPVNGSSWFELCDFNNDGKMDILYTCGDNADYSQVLKPYHGVYVYLNNGDNKFTQDYFYPINGCFKALGRDFDKDGDIDIAAISFFADYANQPEEGFVFLNNKGNLSFEASSFPGAKSGRWLTMDAGDIDKDGNTDIILGNFSMRPSAIPTGTDWKKGPPFIVLKNTSR
jgi:hypothetical protein